MKVLGSLLFVASFLIRGVPAPKGGRQCINFTYRKCLDNAPGFILEVESSNSTLDPKTQGFGFWNFLETNGKCAQAAFQKIAPGGAPVNNTKGVIFGVGNCATIGETSGVRQLRNARYCSTFCVGESRRLVSYADEAFDLAQGHMNKEKLEQCKDFEYDGYLHVDDHFTVFAVPRDEATSVKCPMVAAHIIFDENDKKSVVVKEGLLWNDIDNGKARYEDALYTGKWRGGDIVKAAQLANYTKSGVSKYNILSNNCAVFAVNIARLLGVKIDAKVTGYVTRRLLQQTSVIKRVRDSYAEFFGYGDRRLRGDKNDLSDKELMELVVEAGAFDKLVQ